jgi:hypothetical protein
MKLRFVDPCGPSCSGGGACLCLEDDSKMHMDLYRDPPELDESGSQNILRASRNTERLFDDGRQFLSTRHVVPMLEQLTISSKDENAKIRWGGFSGEL